ncbi:hypothetical protein EVB91_150 [Rhizobium phage RHph_I1_18]|nr:hypothetical protein EVB91_150 [Rhizobium phage RHph_I1_18]
MMYVDIVVICWPLCGVGNFIWWSAERLRQNNRSDRDWERGIDGETLFAFFIVAIVSGPVGTMTRLFAELVIVISKFDFWNRRFFK